MGDKDWRFPGTPATHYPVPKPKLQEGRQEETMMGDKMYRTAKA